MARRKHKFSLFVWLRRLSQTAFFLLFVYLFLQTVYRPINQTGRGVKFFFQVDPLTLLSTWIRTHQVGAGLLLGLVTLAVTFLAGRWFCGWVCPFGAIHNLLTSWRKTRVKERIAAGGFTRWQKAKYYLLVALLVGAFFGLNLSGWFDPFSYLFRSTAVVVFPAGNDVVKDVFTWIYQADPGVGKVRVTAVSEPIYEVLRRHVLAATQPYYYGALLIGVLFVAIVFLNWFRARFWCRYLCPLGALLGFTGKNPLVRLERDTAQCNQCGLCVADCQGGADPSVDSGWKASECFYCGNCRAACPHGAIGFEPGPKALGGIKAWAKNFLRPAKPARLDMGRRALLLAGTAGAGTALLARVDVHGEQHTFDAALVRPPGSLPEDEFLSTCVRCGECMRVCPTNAIHPATGEGGWTSLWTPVLKMHAGYCEYECNLCSQVCPTHAIRLVTLAEKQKIHIGTAFFDRNRCLPYASARTCIVCEEHCPTPKKAIWFEEVSVLNAAGEHVTVKQPRVNLDLCIGCGICENKCPISDRRGVYVTSVGETRNPKNQVLLSSGDDSMYGY